MGFLRHSWQCLIAIQTHQAAAQLLLNWSSTRPSSSLFQSSSPSFSFCCSTSSIFAVGGSIGLRFGCDLLCRTMPIMLLEYVFPFSFYFLFFCPFVLVYNIGVFLNLFGWLENVRKMERSWEFECGVFVWELEERVLFGFFLSPSSDLLLFGFPLSVWLVGECKKWRDWGFESWVFLLFGDSGKCMVGIFFFSLFGWWENLSISMELWTLNLRFFLFSTRHVWWFFPPLVCLLRKFE